MVGAHLRVRPKKSGQTRRSAPTELYGWKANSCRTPESALVLPVGATAGLSSSVFYAWHCWTSQQWHPNHHSPLSHADEKDRTFENRYSLPKICAISPGAELFFGLVIASLARGTKQSQVPAKRGISLLASAGAARWTRITQYFPQICTAT